MLSEKGDRIEYLWHIYENIADYIKFSDTKSGAVLAANGVVAGIGLSNSGAISGLTSRGPVFTVLTVFAVVCLLSSAGSCVAAILPKLRVGEPSSVVFFAHISKRCQTAQEYRTAVDGVFENGKEVTQLQDQIWALARVATRKFRLTGIGVWLFSAHLALVTTLFLLVVLVQP